MKYEKEIKQLEAERGQVKVQIDKAVAVKNQIEQNMQRLIIDYNGIQKAIEILARPEKPEKEAGEESPKSRTAKASSKPPGDKSQGK